MEMKNVQIPYDLFLALLQHHLMMEDGYEDEIRYGLEQKLEAMVRHELYVHLSVAIPPKLRVSDFMGYLKGKSTLMIYDRHPELQSKWDKAFWARGYYVETIGNITDEAVQKYIKEQAEESRREDSSSTAL